MTSMADDQICLRAVGEAIADAINSRDAARFANHWIDDGQWEVTAPVGSVFRGHVEIRKGIEAMLGRWDFFSQLPFAFRAEVDGDRARVHWTIMDIARSRDTRAGQTRISLVIDEAVRGVDEWRLLSRRQHVAYSDSIQLAGQVFHLDPPEVERLMRVDRETRRARNGG